MKSRRQLEEDLKWRDLACRMASHLGWHAHEVIKRKRPNCSTKIRYVVLTNNEHDWRHKSVKSWLDAVLDMCKFPSWSWPDSSSRNPFYGTLSGEMAGEEDLVNLEILGFGDFVELLDELRKRSGHGTK